MLSNGGPRDCRRNRYCEDHRPIEVISEFRRAPRLHSNLVKGVRRRAHDGSTRYDLPPATGEYRPNENGNRSGECVEQNRSPDKPCIE